MTLLYKQSINKYRVTFVDNNYQTKTLTMWATPTGVEEWVVTNHKGGDDSSVELIEVGPIQAGEPVLSVEEVQAKMNADG